VPPAGAGDGAQRWSRSGPRHPQDLCSLLAALDIHPRVVMRILRHSKIAVTMEIYTEAPCDATRHALRRLSDWLT